MGTPATVPILAAVGRPEDVAEGLSLGPELGDRELVFEEEVAAGSEVTDFVAMRLFVQLDLTVIIELEVVVTEIAEDIMGFNVVNAVEVVVGSITNVSSSLTWAIVPSGAGLVDKVIVISAVAVGKLEGECVPHVVQPPDSGLVVRH